MMSPLKEQIIEANRYFGWNEAQTLTDFNNEHSEYYCLVNQDKLLGYVALHHILDEASINIVYMDKTFRQQGLATELLVFVLNQLSQRQVKNIFLEVRASNHPAIHLYQKTGFDLLIKRKNYYQNPMEDAYIFQKNLTKGDQDESKE